jgi:hypothetical protein
MARRRHLSSVALSGKEGSLRRLKHVELVGRQRAAQKAVRWILKRG